MHQLAKIAPILLFLIVVMIAGLVCSDGDEEAKNVSENDDDDDTFLDDDDDNNDDNNDNDNDDDNDDNDTATASCPQGMSYVPGGHTTVVYYGQRWGDDYYTETQWVDGFCIDQYEASQPDATSGSQGSWSFDETVPAAQTKSGVLPWATISWEQAKTACEKAGKRLPTLAEWQTAFSGLNHVAWPWGNDWEDHGCHVDKAIGVYPTGACCFKPCEYPPCKEICDMVGNVSEWIDGYWDTDCYGTDMVLVAGGSAHLDQYRRNQQSPDPDHSGCWLFDEYALKREGLHFHTKDTGLDDDGFRCALSVGE